MYNFFFSYKSIVYRAIIFPFSCLIWVSHLLTTFNFITRKSAAEEILFWKKRYSLRMERVKDGVDGWLCLVLYGQQPRVCSFRVLNTWVCLAWQDLRHHSYQKTLSPFWVKDQFLTLGKDQTPITKDCCSDFCTHICH